MRRHSATVLGVALMAACLSSSVFAQSMPSSITIVSDPSDWYVDTPAGPAPSPEALIQYPELTSIPGPIPEHWRVTRLDPWTEARVLWLNGSPSVVTWGTNRVLPNWHEYRTPFLEMSRGKAHYTRNDLPRGHAMHAEFHMADRNRDGRISRSEHTQFFGVE